MYTTVLGVDRRHLEHLALVWPTWMKHKPSLRLQPLVVFHDVSQQVSSSDVHNIIGNDCPETIYIEWPPSPDCVYDDDPLSGRFGEAQRYKMLSGFVHVPGQCVTTPYWLKIDLDVVALGMDDWVNPEWFANSPAIVASGWGYTKPAWQMLVLDDWAARHAQAMPEFVRSEPLRLAPAEGSNKVKHRRIISWCAFFNTQFTHECSKIANEVCEPFHLPVPSQDGYLWYMAARGQHLIRTVRMKELGWKQSNGVRRIKSVIESMK